MLSSDRGLIAALVGWLAFASFILWDHQQQQKPEIYCEGRAAAQECRPEQYVTERAGIARPLERAISNPEPRSGQDHEKRDLAAQEASAVFAFWMVLISGFGAVVTALATVLLYQQIKLTREAVEDTSEATDLIRAQNALAADTARRQLRAYVSTEDEMVIGFHAGGPAIFSTKVYNRGQTPAYDVKVWSIVTAADAEPDNAKIRQRGPPPAQSSSTIAPGQWVLHSNAAKSPLGKDAYMEITGGSMTIIFAGVIAYKDTFGKRRFSTFKFYHSGGDFKTTKFDLTACGRGNKSN